MSVLQCIVVTPEATVVEETADFVALPLFDGEIGIGVGHSPLIGRLGFGEMRIRQGGKVRRFYVDGGFVQVADNVVSVMTGRAVPAEQLNRESAQLQLAAARGRPATGDELLAIRDKQQAQARALLRVAERANG